MSQIQEMVKNHKDHTHIDTDIEVSIKIFFPDGSVTIIKDPENYNFADNRLWIKVAERELWFSQLPFFISDKRKKQQRPKIRAIKANFQ